MNSKNIWHADLYDEKLSFVSDYGKDVVDLLQPKSGESILDIGCGTGSLTFEISKSGADITGIDNAIQMIEKARLKYPHISFEFENAESFNMEKQYDAVFSNAALHWMKQADLVVESIGRALKPGGRFVAEFGGKGNIQRVIRGIVDVLANEYNIKGEDRNPWYFPSVGEYSNLLEEKGFTVTYAHLFERPTRLTGEKEGLNHWLESFADDFFPEFTLTERNLIFEQVKKELESDLFKSNAWEVDYKRLRIVAIKNDTMEVDSR